MVRAVVIYRKITVVVPGRHIRVGVAGCLELRWNIEYNCLWCIATLEGCGVNERLKS
jgi:hypothetical protein